MLSSWDFRKHSFVAGPSPLPVSSVCCQDMNIPKMLSTHPGGGFSKMMGRIPQGCALGLAKLSVGVASALPQTPSQPPFQQVVSVTGCKCKVINGCHFPPRCLQATKHSSCFKGTDTTPIPSPYGRVNRPELVLQPVCEDVDQSV